MPLLQRLVCSSQRVMALSTGGSTGSVEARRTSPGRASVLISTVSLIVDRRIIAPALTQPVLLYFIVLFLSLPYRALCQPCK